MSKAEKWAPVINPLLNQNEAVEFAVIGAIGQVSLRDQLVAGAIASVVSLGMFTMLLRPQPVAFILTNNRLLMLETDRNGLNPKSKIVAALPLGTFTFRPVSSVLLRKYDLVDSQKSELRLTFPMSKKKAADELAYRIRIKGVL